MSRWKSRVIYSSNLAIAFMGGAAATLAEPGGSRFRSSLTALGS
jgi:hypothetical protein